MDQHQRKCVKSLEIILCKNAFQEHSTQVPKIPDQLVNLQNAFCKDSQFYGIQANVSEGWITLIQSPLIH